MFQSCIQALCKTFAYTDEAAKEEAYESMARFTL